MIEVSKDHKGEDSREQERIIKAGGRIAKLENSSIEWVYLK